MPLNRPLKFAAAALLSMAALHATAADLLATVKARGTTESGAPGYLSAL
jgi:hypothetical protein